MVFASNGEEFRPGNCGLSDILKIFHTASVVKLKHQNALQNPRNIMISFLQPVIKVSGYHDEKRQGIISSPCS